MFQATLKHYPSLATLPGPNTLAYLAPPSVTKKKVLYHRRSSTSSCCFSHRLLCARISGLSDAQGKDNRARGHIFSRV
jgi:hypothetical protein